MAIEPLGGCSATAACPKTPQERAAAVLADLALRRQQEDHRRGGRVKPLVEMLSSGSPSTDAAAGALWHLAALGNNKAVIADARHPAAVARLANSSQNGQKFVTGAWHLASSADNKTQMSAGAILLLVAVLEGKQSDAREHAAAVVGLARSQGGNKKQIFPQGIKPLIKLLQTPSPLPSAAARAVGFIDGKDGVYDKHIAEAGPSAADRHAAE